MAQIISIREHPKWLGRAADYFASRWGIDKTIYTYSINASISTKYPIPRWYLMLRGDEINCTSLSAECEIIGGYGLIDNDFMAKTDLCPWLCALYVEPTERGQNLGAQLLAHSRKEAAKLGYENVYLNTDHIGYYEKYDWRYIGDFTHISGTPARVYEADVMRD